MRRDSFTVKQWHDFCSFSCKPKQNSKHTSCEAKWITLNVMDDVTSLSTETTSTTKTSNYITTKYKSSSVRIPTSVSSPLSSSSPFEQDTTTMNKRYNPLSPRSVSESPFGGTTMITGTSITTPATSLLIYSGNSVSSTLMATSVSQTTKLLSRISTKVENNICENSLSSACICVETTSAGNDVGSTMSIPKFSNKTLIIVISCIVLVFAIIIVILCVHITFYKIGIRSCNDKEEWVNPIYESADNGAQLPIIIPDGGNPYDTVNSPRQVADFSSAMSTKNNVHQINLDLGSTNEIPMVQVEAAQHVADELLDYTVTAFNVGSMKSKKPSCKKIKSSAATEELSLPRADDISPPPASPHLYEMLNDSVRS